MEFLDKLGKKASETYKIAAKKTEKLAKETKFKLQINDLKSQVKDTYIEIGKKVYERHEEGKKTVNFKTDLEEEIKKMENLTSEIAKTNKEIKKLNEAEEKEKKEEAKKEAKKETKKDSKKE